MESIKKYSSTPYVGMGQIQTVSFYICILLNIHTNKFSGKVKSKGHYLEWNSSPMQRGSNCAYQKVDKEDGHDDQEEHP